jgi:hypothetical protein
VITDGIRDGGQVANETTLELAEANQLCLAETNREEHDSPLEFGEPQSDLLLAQRASPCGLTRLHFLPHLPSKLPGDWGITVRHTVRQPGRLLGGLWGHIWLARRITVRHTVRQPGRLRGGLWRLFWFARRITVRHTVRQPGRLRGGLWRLFWFARRITVRHTVRQPGRLRGGLWLLSGLLGHRLGAPLVRPC